METAILILFILALLCTIVVSILLGSRISALLAKLGEWLELARKFPEPAKSITEIGEKLEKTTKEIKDKISEEQYRHLSELRKELEQVAKLLGK